MRNIQRKSKQWLSLVLAVVLLATSPMSVLAEEAVAEVEAAEEVVVTMPEEEVLGGTAEPAVETFTENNTSASEPVEVTTFANGLPKTIAAGETLKLDKDYVMEAGQWFESIEGTLDGQGHTITLTDKPLANVVTGTIQNLGVIGEKELTSESHIGTMAVKFSGNIYNCFSTVKVLVQGWNGNAGGLVGESTKGNIENSYFAGTSRMEYGEEGGMVGYNSSELLNLKQCCYSSGLSPIAMGTQQIATKIAEKFSLEQMKKQSTVEYLNTNNINTGYYWALPTDGSNQGLPVLVKGTIVAPDPQKPNKTELENLVKTCNEFTADGYTAESWNKFSEALTAAKNVLEDPEATIETINTAKTNLEMARDGLKKEKPNQPVAPPTDPAQIQHINSEADLDRYATGTGYYVLDQDITITDMFAPFGEFNGVLDGQGHTITISGDRPYVYESIGEQGVFQNIHFTGTINDWEARGPVGKNLRGTIVNCYSDVKGNNACGFAKYLDGGSIINSYSISEGKKGVLVNRYNAGTLVNTYWLDTAINSVEIPKDALVNSSAKSDTEMKSKDFIAVLNNNKGTHGTTWGQDSTGYPYFGADQGYNPDKPNIPANKYDVVFEPEKNVEVAIENQTFLTSPDEADSSGLAGHFKLKNVPETSKVEWSLIDVKPEGSLMIGMDEGDLSVMKEGTATLKATEIKADGSVEDVAWVQIISKAKKLVGIQLMIDGTDVTDGRFTVAGSEEKIVEVKAKYDGSEGFVPVNPKSFSYVIKDESMIHSMGTSAFLFKKPGTSSITVTSNKDASVKATVEITSTYVPVTSVKPGISGDRVLHGVNANDYVDYAFNPEPATVVVEPGNASYAGSFTVESSNKEIAQYKDTYGYIASKAGTVTYTAKIEQTNPENGKVEVVSGTTEVNYKYQNPLTAVSVPNGEITLKLEEKKQPLDLTFTGALSDAGWNVTFPNMKWEYDQEGIVSIGKTEPGYWKKDAADEGKPDYGLFVSGDKYEIIPLKAGTVTVTGTPLDTTNNVQPVTFKVTVIGADKPSVDMDALIQKGLNAAEKHFADRYPTNNYTYNSNDWIVYGLLRAGKGIPEESLKAYYESVENKAKGWADNQKPTDIERVMITLQAMNKDITNVGGKNLAAMIYNHPSLQVGSNELGWALLALDMKNTEIPADAKWNRDSMIKELLKFQTEKGGFGLNDNQTESVDTTAMALQALAPYRAAKPEVATAIEKGLAYLKTSLPENYNYGTSESIAQVILTLTILDIDPLNSEFGTEANNMFLALMDTYYSENGFGHTNNVPSKYVLMPSVQAHQALTAYVQFKKGEKKYWDLTDGTNPKPPVVGPEKPEPEIPPTPEKPVEVGTVSLKIMDGIVREQMYVSSEADKVATWKLYGKTAFEKIQDQLWNTGNVEEIKTKGIIFDGRITIYSNDTAKSIIERACNENGITISIRDESYIEMIAGLQEFDRGQQSGWKYTVDQVFPAESIADQTVAEGEIKDNSVITVEYTNEGLGKDLEENAELKTPGVIGGSLKEEFKRNQYHYTIETSNNEISFKPEMYSRYSLVTIEVNGKTYAEEQSIPVEDGTSLKLISRKNMRGEDVKEYIFTVEKKTTSNPEVNPDQNKVPQLVNKKYGVTVEGTNLTSDMELVVTKLDKNHEDVQRMRKEIPSSKSVFRLFDIKLMQDEKEVELTEPVTISIPVGTKYNGKTLTVLHCLKDKVEKLTGKIIDGRVVFETSELNSFGVVIDTEKRPINGGVQTNGSGTGNVRPTGGAAAKTGDSTQNAVWMMLLICSAAIAATITLKRRNVK